MALISTACSSNKCEPVIKTEIVYVPKVVEKVVIVKCTIDVPLCDVLDGKLDDKFFTAVKCITDLKMYIGTCNK